MLKFLKNSTLIILFLELVSCKPSPNSNVLFDVVDGDSSGLIFSNDLKHDVSSRHNLFDFDYFYNGAGVGIADLNNDKLPDIFFSGNQVDNRLFVNKGNLKFEDVTETSKIDTRKYWSNGVSFVDINDDGFLDIYVSQGGPHEEHERGNLLFVNQGDLSFIEKAEEYGLNDTGFSTQTAFFDYDLDGDLDCFVANENPLYGVDPKRFYKELRQNPALLHGSSSHLYENRDGRFVDITASAGLLKPSFALGLVISDINEDGLLDIYIANDYFIPDAMYINQGNGSFFDEIKIRTSQVSFYGMGADIADLNNDLKPDVLVLDMASDDHYKAKTQMASMDVDNFNMLVDDFSYAHQYMFNTLQINVGNGQFRNKSHQFGLAKTNWSWAGLINDFNNDGRKDIYVTNGYRRLALDNDFKNEVAATQRMYSGRVPLDVKLELYEKMPTEKVENIFFSLSSSGEFENITSSWVGNMPSYSNGAAYGDLDSDGDLDLVVNNIDQNAFLLKNNSIENGLGNYLQVEIGGETTDYAKVHAYYGSENQMVEIGGVRGYFSSVEPIAHFGLGSTTLVDSIKVVWPNGRSVTKYAVETNQRLQIMMSSEESSLRIMNEDKPILSEISSEELGIAFRHKENLVNDFEKEVLLPYKQSSFGPMMVKGDVNGDGLDDMFVGGASGQAGSIYIQGDGGFTEWAMVDLVEDSAYEDVASVFVDIDQDDDLDLIVVSGGNAEPAGSKYYEDRIYLNDGFGLMTRSNLSFSTFEVGGAVRAIDYDADGDMDLLFGNRIVAQSYPAPSSSFLFRNDGGTFTDVTQEVAPDLTDFGIINDVLVTDFNSDGLEDFIVAGEWTGIGLFENTGSGFIVNKTEVGLEDIKGWWFSITETDFNGDGIPDYVLGNVGLNTKFKASIEKPFKVFANDFDGNGTLDIVLSKKYKDEYVPVRGKECSTQQMPFISKKFKTYDAFANASVEDIFAGKLEDSLSYEANEFRSMVLINKGESNFEISYLPYQIQSFPLLDCISTDVDQDGLEDLIVAGNIYNTEVETPRWDAGTGQILINKGGVYEVLPMSKSGLFINGNLKDLEILQMENGKRLLVGAVNDAELAVFEWSSQ